MRRVRQDRQSEGLIMEVRSERLSDRNFSDRLSVLGGFFPRTLVWARPPVYRTRRCVVFVRTRVVGSAARNDWLSRGSWRNKNVTFSGIRNWIRRKLSGNRFNHFSNLVLFFPGTDSVAADDVTARRRMNDATWQNPSGFVFRRVSHLLYALISSARTVRNNSANGSTAWRQYRLSSSRL